MKKFLFAALALGCLNAFPAFALPAGGLGASKCSELFAPSQREVTTAFIMWIQGEALGMQVMCLAGHPKTPNECAVKAPNFLETMLHRTSLYCKMFPDTHINEAVGHTWSVVVSQYRDAP